MFRLLLSRRTLALPVFIAAYLSSTPASAFNLKLPKSSATLRVGITQSIIGEYHADFDVFSGNPNDKYFDFKNRSEFLVMHGTTSFRMRLDGYWFAGVDELLDPQGLPTPRPSSKTTVEKVTLSSIQRHFDATAGDFYIRVGRGIALDLTKVDELTRDTTVRGARLELRHGIVRGLVFGGWINPVEVDNTTELAHRVPADLVGGGRIEISPHRNVRLGAHYVGYGLQSPAGGRNASHILGLTLEFPNVAELLTLFAEFDYLNAVRELSVDGGMASYLSATLNAGRWAFLFEFRFYNNFEVQNDFSSPQDSTGKDLYVYTHPPTATRPKQEITNNSRVLGPRLRVDLRLARTTVYLSGSVFWRATPYDDQGFFASALRALDFYGGVQSPIFGGTMEFQAGYRVDTLKESGDIDYSQLFVEAEISWPLFRGQNLELQGEFRKMQKSGGHKFSDLSLGASYRPSRFWSVGITYEYSTEYDDEQLPDGISVRRHFFSGLATVNVTPMSYARVLVGSTRGGMRCLDGFCRTTPPFLGARAEVVFQF